MLTLLKQHVAKDRFAQSALQGAYFDSGLAVATDGHRLVAINSNHVDLSTLAKEREGQIYDFENHCAIDSKYPNYKQLIPDITDYKMIEYTFPTWFKSIKKSRPAGGIYLSHFGFSLYSPKDTLSVAINISYLAPYAGYETKIYFKTETRPIVIKSIQGHEWTAIVMPMRK